MEEILRFRDERNWKKFHTGENLAKSICIEAAELLEVFQWFQEEKSVDKVKEELADVMIYSFLMAHEYNLDVDEIIRAKLERNKEKYPVDKSFGNAQKYNEYK